MAQPLNKLDDLMMEELEDLYSAEQILSDELQVLSNSASNPMLKDKLWNYAQDASNEARTLREFFSMLGKQPTGEVCAAMNGLVQEAKEVLNRGGTPAVMDAAIIGLTQKMKHYEIAGYGTFRTFADMLGKQQVASMAADILHDETRKDKELTSIAMSTINPQAKAA